MTQIEELEFITKNMDSMNLSFKAERNLLLALIAKNLAIIADALVEKNNKDKK